MRGRPSTMSASHGTFRLSEAAKKRDMMKKTAGAYSSMSATHAGPLKAFPAILCLRLVFWSSVPTFFHQTDSGGGALLATANLSSECIICSATAVDPRVGNDTKAASLSAPSPSKH